jgi:hypothetical protein
MSRSLVIAIDQVPPEYYFNPYDNNSPRVLANLSNKIIVLKEPSNKEYILLLEDMLNYRTVKRYKATKDSGSLFAVNKIGDKFNWLSARALRTAGLNPSVEISKDNKWRNEIITFLDSKSALELRKYLNFNKSIVDYCEKLKNEGFACSLNALTTPKKSNPKYKSKSIISTLDSYSVDVLLEMYARGWILLNPKLASAPPISNANLHNDYQDIFIRSGLDKNMLLFSSMTGVRKTNKAWKCTRILLLCTNIKSITDLSQDIVDSVFDLVRDKLQRHDVTKFNSDYILNIECNRELFLGSPPKITATKKAIRDSREIKILNQRGNGSFQWAVNASPLLERWAELFRTYCKHQTKSAGLAILCVRLNSWLDYLLELRDKFGDEALSEVKGPEDVIRSAHISPSQLAPRKDRIYYLEWLYNGLLSKNNKTSIIQYYNGSVVALDAFFRWYARESEKPELQYTLNLISDVLPYKESPSSTTRTPLSPKISNIMREILTNNDYEWAKTLDEDYFYTVEGKRIWSPCRAVAMETLLTLPWRFDSLQSTDTGEEDGVIYDPSKNCFIKNMNDGIDPLRRLGIFREFRDASGVITGYYATNNKTTDGGVEIKWDHPELRKKICDLIAFNNLYGGKTPSCHRSEIKNVAPAISEKYPYFYPVFRDLANRFIPERQTPVSSGRMFSFLLNLLDKTEMQLNEEIGPDETPYILITERHKENNLKRRPAGTPKKGIIDLHGLRVTGISNFALAGLPVTIIAEFLAGHVSILMNLYYQKLSISVINSVIDKAYLKIKTSPKLSTLDFVRSDQAIVQALFGASITAEAIDGLAKNQRGIWSVTRGFICPNGGSLCGKGNLEGANGNPKIPCMVEGGEGNCPLCRYALAGPMTLSEQILSLQAFMGEFYDHFLKREHAKREYDAACTAGDREKSKIIEREIEGLERENATLLKTFSARHHWIGKSLSANSMYDRINELRNKGLSLDEIKAEIFDGDVMLPKDSLLTMGDGDDLKFNMECCTDEEFIATIATIGQCSQIDKVPSMSLRFARLMDKMLGQNGVKPFLYSLDEGTATAAAVQMGYILSSYYRRVSDRSVNSGGRAQLAELIRGERSLDADDPSGQLVVAFNACTKGETLVNGFSPLPLDDVLRKFAPPMVEVPCLL